MIARVVMLTAAVAALFTGGAFAEDVNPVVGKAGDVTLREADLERLISYQAPAQQKQLQEQAEQRTQFVRQLLTAKAVADRARKAGFDRKPEMKEQLGYVIDNYLAEQYLEKVVIAGVTLPEEELKKFYKENEKDFLLPEAFKVRHIYVEAGKDATAEEKAKAKAKAEAVLERLKKGEDFAKLAQEVSEDAATAAKGGDLGFLSPGKTNSEEFEKAAFALKPGEISGAVETPFGYHIIKIDERQEKRTASYDEAKEYIRAKLQGEFERKKVQEFIETVTKEAGLQVAGEKPAAPKEQEKPEAAQEKEEK